MRALRFMDFDQKHDWPGLDETTFRGAEHKKRVEIAEWAFWNLFQQWDPKTIEFVCRFLLDVLLFCRAHR